MSRDRKNISMYLNGSIRAVNSIDTDGFFSGRYNVNINIPDSRHKLDLNGLYSKLEEISFNFSGVINEDIEYGFNDLNVLDKLNYKNWIKDGSSIAYLSILETKVSLELIKEYDGYLPTGGYTKYVGRILDRVVTYVEDSENYSKK